MDEPLIEHAEKIASWLLGTKISFGESSYFTIAMVEIYLDGFGDVLGDYYLAKDHSYNVSEIKIKNRKGITGIPDKNGISGNYGYVYNSRAQIILLNENIPASIFIKDVINSEGNLIARDMLSGKFRIGHTLDSMLNALGVKKRYENKQNGFYIRLLDTHKIFFKTNNIMEEDIIKMRRLDTNNNPVLANGKYAEREWNLSLPLREKYKIGSES